MAKRRERLQVVSDLHLEFYADHGRGLLETIRWDEDASAVILAGDIGVPTGRRRKTLDHAFGFLSSRFPTVFFVPGNHEFYRTQAPAGLDKIRRTVANHPKVTLLEPGVIARWADRRVVGATLWFRNRRTNARLAGMLSDFAEISGFVPWVYEQNRSHVAWLNEAVREGDIVVTHHLPSLRSVAPQYENDPLNVFFVCEMDELIRERRPALWVHGHTHEPCRYSHGATTVVCNPFGYPDEPHPASAKVVWSAP
jgi:predicted phosphodiesterase